MMRWKVLLAMAIAASALVLPARPAERARAARTLPSGRPVTGKAVPGWEALETAIDEFMTLINAQAATAAVAVDGRIVYSRGMGWKDKDKTRPTPRDAIVRIASCSKPITAALVKKLFREGLLKPDTRVYAYLGIQPYKGMLADPRWKDITVEQLLEHKGGFDRNRAGDPMFAIDEIRRELGLTGRVTSVNVIQYMLTKPLQFNPGERSEYSNFGYCLLGRVIEKASGLPYVRCVQRDIARPLHVDDLILTRDEASKRDPREVWYPAADTFCVEVMDAHGGLATSAPSLCKFLRVYWIDGRPRKPDEEGNWTFFGSFPGETAMILQRGRIEAAVLLNARRDGHYSADNAQLLKSVEHALRQVLPEVLTAGHTADGQGRDAGIWASQ
jgi:CubicO group peptidase (beta-lactamase class C family)